MSNRKKKYEKPRILDAGSVSGTTGNINPFGFCGVGQSPGGPGQFCQGGSGVQSGECGGGGLDIPGGLCDAGSDAAIACDLGGTAGSCSFGVTGA